MNQPKQIPPRMTNLPKMVDTYERVCGNNNPFTGFTGYGYTAAQYNDYMHLFHGMLPVMDDYTRLALQISLTLAENAPKYAAMRSAMLAAEDIDPTSEMHYTDTTDRTGSDTDYIRGTEMNERTGGIEDGGTDSTTNGATVTDKTVTYDNGTLRDTGQSITSGTGSITHGKTTTYRNLRDTLAYNDRENEKMYDSTVTRTVDGYKNAPADIMRKYTDFVRNNNVFMEVINDVISAISCIVYIPVMPENYEEE